jgi:Txe/YoeB family toxin of Txe-Axe toxin-antitoxin module
MEIVFTEKAFIDLEYWNKSGDSSIRNKITHLFSGNKRRPVQRNCETRAPSFITFPGVGVEE